MQGGRPTSRVSLLDVPDLLSTFQVQFICGSRGRRHRSVLSVLSYNILEAVHFQDNVDNVLNSSTASAAPDRIICK